MKISLTPLGDRVLVLPEREEATSPSGIIAVTRETSAPTRGTVVAIGLGKVTDKGDRLPMDVAVDQKVLFPKYGHEEIEVDGEQYFLMPASSILAILA